MERVCFELAVETERPTAASRQLQMTHSQELDHWQGAVVDRLNISHALVGRGYLLFLSRHTLTIRTQKWQTLGSNTVTGSRRLCWGDSNLYEYTANGPTDKFDPTGFVSESESTAPDVVDGLGGGVMMTVFWVKPSAAEFIEDPKHKKHWLKQQLFLLP